MSKIKKGEDEQNKLCMWVHGHRKIKTLKVKEM